MNGNTGISFVIKDCAAKEWVDVEGFTIIIILRHF